MQKKIELYSTTYCPFCARAKALLDKKGYSYEIIDASDDKVTAAMVIRAGGRTSVPQIFVGTDIHIGGYDDLHALEAQGKLDSLISK